MQLQETFQKVAIVVSYEQQAIDMLIEEYIQHQVEPLYKNNNGFSQKYCTVPSLSKSINNTIKFFWIYYETYTEIARITRYSVLQIFKRKNKVR